MTTRKRKPPCDCGGFFDHVGAFVHAERCERKPKTVKQVKKELAELLMTHLGLAELHARRLQKVLTRKAPLFELPKGQKPIGIPKGPMRVEELEFLDDEFKNLIGDAIAARMRLHVIIGLMQVSETKPRRR